VLACQAPCDQELPVSDTYKIGGSRFTTTHEFTLESNGDRDVVLHVNGPSWVGIIGGGSLTLTGATIAYLGSQGVGRDSTGGVTPYIVGAALITLGLAIVFPSMTTDLSQKSVDRDRGRLDAFVREPSWRAPALEAVAKPTWPIAYEARF
jgi:hypothetical protein